MKALSIKQPWLYCITDLDKRVENRTWKPPQWVIGKRIALHSSKSYSRQEYAAASSIAGISLEILHTRGEIVEGAIVATAVVLGWVSHQGIPEFPDLDYLRESKWYCGPIAWVFDDIRKVSPGPAFCRGALGLWNVPPEVLAT